MKKVIFKGFILALVAFSSFSFTACEKQITEEGTAIGELKEGNLEGDCATTLVFMREEEKLAHDVYSNLYELWSVPVFNNISKSETVHTNAIKGLLEIYGIEDPTIETVGEFSNVELQNLYNSLMQTGEASLIDALQVGATIEEVDIIDLEEAMANCTEDTVLVVYQRLANASGNHLRAFVRQLSYQGIDYAPQFLSEEKFAEIINAEHFTGGTCDTVAVSLTSQEEAGLLFMREEEKLAQDVYVHLFGLWNVPVFDFISRSETVHTNQVLSLINKFGLDDPALEGQGSFSNTDLQELYNQLIAQGSESLAAGLIVGATIEEVDIMDLFERMAQTENPTLIRNYSNLEKASEAHLRAFVRQLSINGQSYSPQFLSQEEYDRIIGN